MNLIFIVDKDKEECLEYHEYLSKISTAIVKAFHDTETMLEYLKQTDDNIPTLLIVEKNYTINSGNEILKIVRQAGYSFPIMIISDDESFIKALIGVGAGVFAVAKPEKDKPGTIADFIFRAEILMLQEQTKRAAEENDRKLSDCMDRIESKFSEFDAKISKIENFVESTAKADILQKVNDFMEQCKKKPLLMVIVSLILAVITLLGLKGLKV